MTAAAAVAVSVAPDGALALVMVDDAAAATPLAHHRAVVAALRACSCAPVRHGMRITMDDVLADAQAYRRIALLGRTHVEIGVALQHRAEASPAPASGRGFLRLAAARAQSGEAFRQFSADLAAAFGDISGVEDVRIVSRGDRRVSLALLAERSVAAAVAAAAESFGGPACAVNASGPWPLYSFTPAPAAKRLAA
jgi:hypothetical protein